MMPAPTALLACLLLWGCSGDLQTRGQLLEPHADVQDSAPSQPQSCVDLSHAHIECDPMGGKCDGPGSACDVYNGQDGFPAGTRCFPQPNEVPAGGACDNLRYCMAGTHCLTGICRAFCCSDADCAAGACEVGQFRPVQGAEELGMCLG